MADPDSKLSVTVGTRFLLSWSADYRLNGVGAWLVAIPLLGIPLLQARAARSALPTVMDALSKAAERIARG